MIIMKGNEVKEEILNELKEKVESLNLIPGLAVVQVGEDIPSNVYIKQKEKMAAELGYKFKHVKLSDSVSEEKIIDTIEKLNADDSIDGVLIQLPLPNQFNTERIQNKVDKTKDVDGLTDINAGKLTHNKKCLIPCTPLGIVELLSRHDITITGKNVVIVGRSNLVGKPLAALLTNMDATVTLCHSKTKNINEITRMADIIVVAIGKKDFLKADMISDNAVVIDVGINRFENKLYGDVDFDEVSKKCSYITPVPLGVGPMTVAMLAKNVYTAHLQRRNNN